jgi:hypothetical protein
MLPFGFADRIDIAKICSGLEMQLKRTAFCYLFLFSKGSICLGILMKP